MYKGNELKEEFMKYLEGKSWDMDTLWGWLTRKINSISVPAKTLVIPNEVVGGGQWLELKDYLPIDIEMVKKKWIGIYNIPTGIWKSIELDLMAINNNSIPNTARLFTLNHLPFCVIKILNDSRREA